MGLAQHPIKKGAGGAVSHKEEKARKSVDSTLEGARRQAEEQRQLLHDAKDQLASSQEQLIALKKKLKEAQKLKGHARKLRVEAEKAMVEPEKARDEAEQHGYDVGMAETEDTFRAQVPAGMSYLLCSDLGGSLKPSWG